MTDHRETPPASDSPQRCSVGIETHRVETRRIAEERSAARCLKWLLLCYGASFVLPTIKTTGNFGTLFGVQAFIGSLLALTDGYLYWLANPAFWLGLYFFRHSRPQIAASCGLIATLIALSVPVLMSRNEQLNPPPPGLSSTLLPGYYCWLASFVLFVIQSSTRRES